MVCGMSSTILELCSSFERRRVRQSLIYDDNDDDDGDGGADDDDNYDDYDEGSKANCRAWMSHSPTLEM